MPLSTTIQIGIAYCIGIVQYLERGNIMRQKGGARNQYDVTDDDQDQLALQLIERLNNEPISQKTLTL